MNTGNSGDANATSTEPEGAASDTPEVGVVKPQGRLGGATRARGRHNRGGISETNQPTGNPNTADGSKR
ncbi:MAG: hypothetical protein ABIY70_26310 [Capsulimonas sp.]|uniref:hypothetical protein n=1 Tax=Capsulimonas sp. TaxID=2494211 RepID=UPI00326783DA